MEVLCTPSPRGWTFLSRSALWAPLLVLPTTSWRLGPTAREASSLPSMAWSWLRRRNLTVILQWTWLQRLNHQLAGQWVQESLWFTPPQSLETISPIPTTGAITIHITTPSPRLALTPHCAPAVVAVVASLRGSRAKTLWASPVSFYLWYCFHYFWHDYWPVKSNSKYSAFQAADTYISVIHSVIAF